MTPSRRINLERLLNPRHVAVIGGREAETVAGECVRIGYRGPVWPVNPRRESIGGHRCFRSVDDLPEPPDAAFVAVPREAAIDTVARLAAMGAGGVVCHTAGFAETGGEGARLETALIEAAGDLALIGPNCYGFINYLDRAALWPFAHGGTCPGSGAAIVTQSGMLSSDLTMSQRSVPFAFMASIGNQSVVTLADCVEVFAGFRGVQAIGLHIEEIPDVAKFSEAVREAVCSGIPVVALKTGVSEIGTRLTVSHTGALSGDDDLYQALFDRLGVIRVTTPAQLLETLKFLCVAGVPDGNRVAGLTCSGGAAAMLADYAQVVGLRFPPPSDRAAERLAERLPSTATVSNPLDYTTPIWGLPERVRPVFEAVLGDPFDVAVLVQDYPLDGLDESRDSYLSDAREFVAATRAADVPAAVCSTLPENIDRATREMLIARGVAPMQGIREALDAIAGAVWHGRRRERIRCEPRGCEAKAGGDTDTDAGEATDAGAGEEAERGLSTLVTVESGSAGAGGGWETGVSRVGSRTRGVRSGTVRTVDEHQTKLWLRGAGMSIPPGRVVSAGVAPGAAAEIGFPVAVKMVSGLLPHKSEAGAVALGISNAAEVGAAIARIRADVRRHDARAVSDRFLVEGMVEPPLVELLVNVRTDSRFGLAMTLASGGVLAELVADAVTILLPAERSDIEEALGRLRVSRLLDGFRGAAPADRAVVVEALLQLASHLREEGAGIEEVEINPLFVLPDRVCAVDALMRVREGSEPGPHPPAGSGRATPA